MSAQGSKYVKFGAATAIILLSLGYLAYTGVQQSKSYYVTIKELRGMDNSVYAKRLRVAGNVQPGSIKRTGTHVEFTLVEQGTTLPVVYTGTVPDPFKEGREVIVKGSMRDGTFVGQRDSLVTKCPSKFQNAPGGKTY